MAAKATQKKDFTNERVFLLTQCGKGKQEAKAVSGIAWACSASKHTPLAVSKKDTVPLNATGAFALFYRTIKIIISKYLLELLRSKKP
jgi:hypothetical protein